MHSGSGIAPTKKPCSLPSPCPGRTSAMQNLQEPFAPARAVLGKLAFSLGIALAWERPSNQDDAANCLAASLFRTTPLTSASQCADLFLVRPMKRYHLELPD